VMAAILAVRYLWLRCVQTLEQTQSQ